ncbi:MAG: hypothetical protein KC733_07155 [Candidatus Omnitrophica bacterium]|nr:hypothetical protein [Candidatus Omnitrophota bacterium]
MRFFFELSTLNYKIRHATAIELNKLFPGSCFAGRANKGNIARKYIEDQNDIKYEKLYDWRPEAVHFLKEDIDYELLKSFEATLPDKSLWRLVAMDRGWGYQFCKGVYLPKDYLHQINSRENILKMAVGYIKFYENIIREFKPDVFFPSNGQNSMTCPIIEQVCKNHNVLYVLPEIIRTQNYECITDNIQYTFPQVNEAYRDFIAGKENLDIRIGEKIYAEMLEDLNKKNFLVTTTDHLTSRWPIPKFIYRSLKTTLGQIIKWFKQSDLRKKNNNIHRQPDNFLTLLHNIYFNIRRHFRVMQLMNPKFYTPYNSNQKYLYFPLHSPNEYSTQVQGTMWINQLMIIEALAKSIPCDWKIIVKEHPGTLVWRSRPMDFYNEIKNYSNVDFVPTDTNTHTIISNAQMVATIVGTTGWEAIFRGIPVIDFEENMYDVLNLSRRCTDFKQLSHAIREEFERSNQISMQERKKRIEILLSAIAKHSFWIEDPIKAAGEADCTREEALEIGKVFAEGIKKFMNYRGIIKKSEELVAAQ